MMVEENKSLIEQYYELEQSLKKEKEETEYYKNISVETGRIRLREIDQLSRLITERKKAEKALREGEELLRATVESTADGILVVDEKGQVTHTNKRFAQLWQIPDELIRTREDKKLLDFVLGQLKEPEVFLSKVQVLYKTSDENFDVLDFKDGRVFERFSSPLIQDGQIAGRVWSFRDITDRKRAERALRESEGKFRFLAEKMVDIVWTIDRNFQTTYVSPSIENVLGFTPEERKRQPLEEMITPESLQKVQIMFLEELQRDRQDNADPDRSITVEVEYYRKDGSTVWMENIVKAIRDPGGEVVGMHGVSRDISERKQTEDTLRESESRYRSLFKNNHSVMLLIDLESADIVDANPAAISYYGWSLEELTAMKITDINILTKEQVFQEMEQAKSEKCRQFIFQHRLSNGDIRDVEVYSGPIKLHGQKLLYSIIYDITDRIQAEESLKWELAVNSSLSKLYKPIISHDSTIEDITNTILDEAIHLTASKHGYVSSVDPNTGENVGHTLTEMLNGQCTVTETKTRIAFPIGRDGLYGGLWGHALDTRKAFFANKPAEHPAAKGLPKGHIPLDRFLTVPVTLDIELVGQIALANKNEDYTEHDLNAIRRLADYYALSIQRMRAEKELQKAHDDLERRVEERTADLIKINERLKQEIVTRKQVKAALQESGEKYRQLFDTVSDAIMLFDVATKEFIDVNGICQSMYGYSKDEFLCLKHSSITAEPEESEQSIKQILSGEISRVPLRYHKRKDGTIFPVEISSGTFNLGDRRILCGVVRDITERKQTEEALRKKRKELSQKAKHLEKVNTALEVLLEHLEEDKKKLEENILINLKKFIFPYIEKLEAGGIGQKNKTYLDIIKTNFNKVIFPFAKNQLQGYLDLTPTEIHVADLIREGKTHKDIALLSNVSPHAVLFHMKNIRKKLGLSHKKINLRTYLQSLTR
jgi:PAS domain S-box-containing protein